MGCFPIGGPEVLFTSLFVLGFNGLFSQLAVVRENIFPIWAVTHVYKKVNLPSFNTTLENMMMSLVFY